LKLSGNSRWIFDFCARHGIRDGFCCPVGPWVLHFWSPHVLHLSPQTRALLYAAAVSAVEQLIKLTARQRLANLPARNALSVREREILRLYSLGSRPRDIAEFAGISERTVRQHLTNIQKKLGARHIGQALTLAKDARLLAWVFAFASIEFNKARADIRKKIATASDMVAATAAAFALALGTALAKTNDKGISSNDSAVDITAAIAGADSINSAAASNSNQILHKTAEAAIDSETIEVIQNGQQHAIITQAKLLNADAEAVFQFDGLDAANALIMTDGATGAIAVPAERTTWHFSDESRGTENGPSIPATANDVSLAISADHGFTANSLFSDNFEFVARPGKGLDKLIDNSIHPGKDSKSGDHSKGPDKFDSMPPGLTAKLDDDGAHADNGANDAPGLAAKLDGDAHPGAQLAEGDKPGKGPDKLAENDKLGKGAIAEDDKPGKGPHDPPNLAKKGSDDQIDNDQFIFAKNFEPEHDDKLDAPAIDDAKDAKIWETLLDSAQDSPPQADVIKIPPQDDFA
jgi:DNA-binding CsgD family transcriptional regulator